MSEASAAQAAAMAGMDAAPASPSAGMLLRQAREAAGMHIGALSVALKVPVKKLEALEADQHGLLPDAVFTRALAASVCRTLKVDPEPILSRLPQQVMPQLQLESSTTDRTSLHAPRALWHAPLLSRLPKPVLVVVALLLLGALALYVMPSFTPMGSVSGSGPASPLAEEAAGAHGATAVATPASPLKAVPAAAEPPVAAPVLTPAPVTAPLATGPVAPPSAPAPMAAPAVAAPGAGLLLFKAKGPSWVEVTDSAGVPQLRKILNTGDTVPVAGVLPLSVVVGRADAIDVVVRGQPFDLAPLARDNVARFQIK